VLTSYTKKRKRVQLIVRTGYKDLLITGILEWQEGEEFSRERLQGMGTKRLERLYDKVWKAKHPYWDDEMEE